MNVFDDIIVKYEIWWDVCIEFFRYLESEFFVGDNVEVNRFLFDEIIDVLKNYDIYL